MKDAVRIVIWIALAAIAIVAGTLIGLTDYMFGDRR